MSEKLSVKEVGKPFKVTVSARKYTGWRRSSYYPTMGGLYGLAIGSDRMRTVTTKIVLNNYLNYGVKKEIEDFLEGESFESTWNCKSKFPWSGKTWIREEIEKWSTYNEDEFKLMVKNYVAGTRAEIKQQLEENIKDYMDFRGLEIYGSVWNDFDVDIRGCE